MQAVKSATKWRRYSAAVTTTLLMLSLPVLPGCFPLVAGAMAGSVAIVLDRRHPGTQAVDRGIQLEAESAFSKLGDGAHLNITVFNKKALLTGETRTDELRARAEQLVRDNANVREVINEVQVGMISALSNRAEDTYLTSKVKSMLVATKEIPSNSMRVTTESKVVYLLGIVTEAEGRRAASVASEISGVNRVVKLFDYITEEERVRIDSERQSAPPETSGHSS